jgi:hypothetical protein
MNPGYVLLIAAGVAMLFGWDLSRRGLNDVKEAANTAKEAAVEVRNTVATTQKTLADATDQQARTLAATQTEAIEKTNALDGALGQVNDALAGLTGRFAPARVAFALAFLLVLAALVALDIISLAVAEGAQVPPT